MSRASGILLHPTSLPGRFGIGTLGEEAYRFADFLVAAGQRLWQVLPLGPTGYGNSPYMSASAFAGNPLLISLEKLCEEGFLEPAHLRHAPPFPGHRVDYEAVAGFKLRLFEQSCRLFESAANKTQRDEYEGFCRKHAWWLDDFALFVALKKAYTGAAWNTWEPVVRDRKLEALETHKQTLAQEMAVQKYIQFQFFRQWEALKRYCNTRGVRLIGDAAIYVAFDSADVWAHQEMFYLDKCGKPTVVAGVPPDYFSKTGQLWGNPLYRWNEMEKDGFRWWVQRLRASVELVDILRLDHFRGFEKYWEIPAAANTAAEGRWVPGPGAKLFEAARRTLGELPVIAEDLGVITPEVTALREGLGFPGTRVLQFAFSGSKDNPHLPYNYGRNLVVYTATHDNDTTVGWFRGRNQHPTVAKEALDKERHLATAYFGRTGEELHWSFIRLALSSVADAVVIPLQDLLGLGSEARMNTPATTHGNWGWRFTQEMVTSEVADRLKGLTQVYGR